MDGRPITADSKHNYPQQPPVWTRSTSSPAVPRLSTLLSPSPVNLDPSQLQIPTRFDLVPVIFPHHSSLYHAQLLQYNKLIAPGRGGGLQTHPLPPLLSPQSVHAGSRSRSSSKVSKEPRAKLSSQICHGNSGIQDSSTKADRVLITGKYPTSRMPPKKPEAAHGLPPRPKHASSPSNLPPHSSSVPSTPRQHARDFSYESMEQSPITNQAHSPRSVCSETSSSVPSLRPLPPRYGGCKYETGPPHSRRRIPYSIGADALEKVDLKTIKSKLSEDDERKLTTDMRELYDRLQPTERVEAKRRKLVRKLENLLNDAWPGHDIRVHLFGSSGNLLCSDDSDVDICIVTQWKELEGVCMLADLLAKHGMEKVVCVSSAKVPIVKVWDPELELACDMNVNNTLALENTRMIKTYVEIDERVRPLAMIVKHWTRRRIVNDAAFGGTLSSYTWICMIIAFLQLRQPPVLPALHQRPHQKLPPKKNGEIASFADDVERLRGYGTKNKSSLGELLFQFFRFYAHEFDYATAALSVRLGRLVTKTEKKWLFTPNNRLCVEEPFNMNRNLGNTADDTAFRGLHLEIRRAFDLIACGNLDECCEQFVFPKEEERIFQKPVQTSRPVLLRSASQQHATRGGRGGMSRGGNRQASQHRNSGNNSSNRRASGSVAYDNNVGPPYMPPGYPMTLVPQDAAAVWGTSQEALMNALQLQENNLRFLQYTQSQTFVQQQAIQHAQRMQGNSAQTQPSNERSRTNSFDTAPLSAPLRPEIRPDVYYYTMQLPQAQAFYAQHGFQPYPSSSSNTLGTEFRRSSQRSSLASDANHVLSGSTTRSQSQPASRPMNGVVTAQGFATTNQAVNRVTGVSARHVNGVHIPSFIPDESHDIEQDDSMTSSPPDDGRGQGYYADPSSPPRGPSIPTPGMPAFGDIGPQSDHFPQVVIDRIKQASRSRSPSPVDRGSTLTGRSPNGFIPAPSLSSANPNGGIAPIIVNGSTSKSVSSNPPRHPVQIDRRAGELHGYDDNPLHANQRTSILSSEATVTPSLTSWTEGSPVSDRPVIVNGSTNQPVIPTTQPAAPHYTDEAISVDSTGHLSVVDLSGATTSPHAASGIPTNPRPPFQRFSHRPVPSPLIAQLDLATSDRLQSNEFPHLSPVYENNSPSPVFTRKGEFPIPYFPSPNPSLNNDRPGKKSDAGKNKSNVSCETSPAKTDAPGGSNPKVNGLMREYGHVRGAKSESDNTAWQKIPAGKKRGANVRTRNGVYPESEQLPKNELERKGG